MAIKGKVPVAVSVLKGKSTATDAQTKKNFEASGQGASYAASVASGKAQERQEQIERLAATAPTAVSVLQGKKTATDLQREQNVTAASVQRQNLLAGRDVAFDARANTGYIDAFKAEKIRNMGGVPTVENISTMNFQQRLQVAAQYNQSLSPAERAAPTPEIKATQAAILAGNAQINRSTVATLVDKKTGERYESGGSQIVVSSSPEPERKNWILDTTLGNALASTSPGGAFVAWSASIERASDAIRARGGAGANAKANTLEFGRKTAEGLLVTTGTVALLGALAPPAAAVGTVAAVGYGSYSLAKGALGVATTFEPTRRGVELLAKDARGRSLTSAMPGGSIFQVVGVQAPYSQKEIAGFAGSVTGSVLGGLFALRAPEVETRVSLSKGGVKVEDAGFVAGRQTYGFRGGLAEVSVLKTFAEKPLEFVGRTRFRGVGEVGQGDIPISSRTQAVTTVRQGKNVDVFSREISLAGREVAPETVLRLQKEQVVQKGRTGVTENYLQSMMRKDALGYRDVFLAYPEGVPRGTSVRSITPARIFSEFEVQRPTRPSVGVNRLQNLGSVTRANGRVVRYVNDAGQLVYEVVPKSTDFYSMRGYSVYSPREFIAAQRLDAQAFPRRTFSPMSLFTGKVARVLGLRRYGANQAALARERALSIERALFEEQAPKTKGRGTRSSAQAGRQEVELVTSKEPVAVRRGAETVPSLRSMTRESAFKALALSQTRTGLRAFAGLGTFQRSGARAGFASTARQIISLVPQQALRVGITETPSVTFVPEQTFVPKITTVTRQGFGFGGGVPAPELFVPSFVPTPEIPLFPQGVPGGGSDKRRSSSQTRQAPRARYKASYVAELFGLRAARAPKFLTGAEIRPMVGRRALGLRPDIFGA